MTVYEIGTGYTSIPARMGAATEIVVEEMTKGLTANGQEVTLVDIADPARLPNELPIVEVRMPKMFSKTDVALGIMHKLKRVVYSISLAKKLKKLIKASNEEVLLHFHNQYNLYFFLKLTSKKIRRKVKIAYTVHSYIWPKEWSEIEDTVKKKYFQEIYCVKNADYVLVLNDKTKEHFTQHLGVKPECIHKIKNGVNTDIYCPLTADQNEEFKKEIGLEGKKYIFQVGSVCDRKNQMDAVCQITDYLKNHSDTAYVFAGGIIDQEYFDGIVEYARQNGIEKQVIYAGELPPGVVLNKYYSAANVMLFPSKLESFGMVIIESLSSGTHVLLAEPLVFDLEQGYTVCKDKNNLEKMLDEYMQNKIVDVDGRNEVEMKYSWKTVAKEHSETWKVK